MSVEIADIPGIDEANQELDRLMAADAAQGGTDGTTKTDAGSVQEEGEHAALTAEIENTLDSGEEAESGKLKAETTNTEARAEAAKAEAPKQTRYEKAKERAERSWQEINAQKEALKTEREAFAKEREQIEQQRREIEERRAKAEAEFSPEQYESAAAKFEAEGKFDLADLAKRKAEDLRRNPPAQRQAQATAAQESQKREWALKAGQEFPELVQTNSPLQQRVAQIMQGEPDLKQHPKGIYLAARIAHLEAESGKGATAAARASELETNLGLAQARIKELEALTAPGGPGNAAHLSGAKSFEQMSDDEQFAELAREAQEVGVLTR
jgi:hypothetical protein